MDIEEIELSNEIKGLVSDKILFETTLKNEQIKLAAMLKGEMGEDIKKVLSGEKVVKLPWHKALKYKIKHFFNKLFNLI